MKTKFFAIIALFALLAACTPSGTSGGPTPDVLATMVAATMQAVTPLAPPPTAMVISVPTSVTMPGSAFAFQNVSMSIPTGFASGARGETIARAEGENVAPWDVAPQHTFVTLEGYALGERFIPPQVIVYPADDFASMNEGAATIIRELRTLIGDNSPIFPETLPHLPLFNADQLFHAHAQKIDFGSGKGVRYITQYSQSFVVVNNNDLLYTFQGLTSDGKYYIAVNLPIITPLLDTMTQPNFSDPNFTGDQYAAYIEGAAKTLNSLASPFFSPSLEVFDQFVMSIVVTP